VRAIHDLGLQHSVSLVGIDQPGLADVVAPGVPVIAQDPVGVRRAAAPLLFARLDGFGGPPHRVILTPRLVARGSGALPPARS
jgi:LacI family transcriptional regulator